MGEKPLVEISFIRVLTKGIILFLFVNLYFGIASPLQALGKFSAYNQIFPGRVRLPYGEISDKAYNLSLYNLEAMFASHEISGKDKPLKEYRVLLIGDSSVWGFLLQPGNTISGYINAAGIKIGNDQTVHAYNLGYPTLSLAKDLLMLENGLSSQPDLIIWLVTLESFPVTKQLDSPIVQNNASTIKDMITDYSINLDLMDSRLVTPNFWGKTLIGERRSLADLVRLQLYGVMWAATGIDQYYPADFEPPQENLANDDTFHGLLPPQLNPSDLSFDILSAGNQISGDIPIILINEPIYLSRGENSDIRYNFFYPRWAYDQYRQIFSDFCQRNRIQCLDEWNLVSPEKFTNSAIHMNPEGTEQLAAEIEDAIRSMETP